MTEKNTPTPLSIIRSWRTDEAIRKKHGSFSAYRQHCTAKQENAATPSLVEQIDDILSLMESNTGLGNIFSKIPGTKTNHELHSDIRFRLICLKNNLRAANNEH